MTHSDRRRFLKGLLGALAQGAGSVVIAAAATSHAVANVTSGRDTDIRKRAEELATAAGASEGNLQAEFLNRAVRAGVGGAFRNGGFVNGRAGLGGGAFRNGGFANGRLGGGAFRNGGFRNW